MANDVSIRVTGQNDSDRALKTAKEGVKDLGNEAQKTTRYTVELYEAERKAAAEASTLGRKLLEAKAAMKLAGDELRDNGGKKAAEDFEKARRAYNALAAAAKDIDFGKSGKTGKSTSLFSTIFGDAEHEAGKIGKAAAGTFASAFEGGVMETFKALPPQAKVAVVGTLVGAAALAAPLIVSVMNGAILTGIGGAGLAVGIIKQVKDPAVAGAFKELGSRVNSDLGAASAPFKGQLIDSAKTFGDAWTKISPNVASALNALAPAVGKLAEGAAKAATILGPSLAKAAGPAEHVLSTIADEIPEIAQQIGHLMNDISDHADAAAMGAKFILFNVEALIAGLDIVVKTMAPVADGALAVARAFHIIDDKPLDHVLKKLDNTTESSKAAGRGMSRLSDETDDMGNSMDDAAGAAEYAARAVYNTADAADQANEAFERLFNQFMSVDEANLKVAEDFSELSKNIRKNGKSLDENTASGQANREMILGMVQDLEAKREADIAAGNGTLEATQKANAAYLSQLQHLRDAAAAAGLNTAALDAMLAKYRAIAGMPDITKQITIINTAVYRTVYDSSGNATGESGRGLSRDRAVGGVIGAANGGNRGNMTLVGEEGWEFVRLPMGSSVMTHGDSVRAAQQMAGQGSARGGGQTAIVVGPGSENAVGQLFKELIRRRVITVKQSAVVKG